MKILELAERTGARVEGLTDDIEISGAAGMDEAGEGHVTFLANPRYTPRVNTTRASAIYLSEEAQTDRQIAILRVKDPYLAYTRALRIFNPEAELEPFVHPSAVIDPTARVAKRAEVIARIQEVARRRVGQVARRDRLLDRAAAADEQPAALPGRVTASVSDHQIARGVREYEVQIPDSQFHPQRASTAMAMPMPPPIHSDATP